MNRFATIFFAFSLAFFLVGASRFFFPDIFEGGFLDFSRSTQEEPATTPENVALETAKTAEQKFLEETPADEEKLLERAEQFVSNGALTLAENDLTVLLQKNPKNKKATLMLIGLHIRSRDFAAAENVVKKALENTFPNDSELLVSLGDIALQQAKIEDAKQTFLLLPANSPERNFFLGLIAIHEGDYDGAEKMIQKAVSSESFGKRAEIVLGAFKEFALFPDGVPLHRDTLLAKALNEVEEFELSLSLSKKVLVENSGYRDAWLVNGYSYLALGKTEFAENAFQQAYEIDPANPAAAYFLGISYKKLADYNRALSYFDRALKNGFDPQKEILQEIADTYVLQENYELAYQEFQKIFEQYSDTPVDEFIRPMNIVLTFLKQPELGILLGNRAVLQYPKEAMAWNLRGWAYLENNQLTEAEQDFSKSENLNPNLPALMLNMGMLKEKQEKYEEALNLYEKAYNIDPLSVVGEKAVDKYNALLK